ncbi:MAG: biotin--[acetyl-CoA-carboxylase] ligase [Candidatus Amulumruptor caecigallinarius]|nr:biotin--[acetyl-CoA-carboxylase] ligase [Candidatus Amulumruptor caecigallinarius]
MNGMFMKIRLASVGSTNAELRRMAADGEAPHGLALCAVEQIAGRGQRGNGWEAEPGANVTMSLMLRPAAVSARRQFLLSMAVSLGVCEAVSSFIPGEDVAVKWPNDIYVGDRKLCGILIENTLSGAMIAASIAGIGVNVNQLRFLSDAPNPVSLAMVAAHAFDVEAVEDAVARAVVARVDAIDAALLAGDEGCAEALKGAYMARLWRREGMHPYRDAATGELFSASIADVATDGTLWLSTGSGRCRGYLFKEVASVL